MRIPNHSSSRVYPQPQKEIFQNLMSNLAQRPNWMIVHTENYLDDEDRNVWQIFGTVRGIGQQPGFMIYLIELDPMNCKIMISSDNNIGGNLTLPDAQGFTEKLANQVTHQQKAFQIFNFCAVPYGESDHWFDQVKRFLGFGQGTVKRKHKHNG